MHAMSFIRDIVSPAALIFVFASAVHAQIPELPQVPDNFDPDIKAAMQSRRDSLINAETRLRSTGAAHSHKCKSVAEGSVAASECLATRDSLKTAAIKLQNKKVWFSKTIDELKRLNEEESTVSQAIRSAVEQMQKIVNQGTAASEEQLRILNEELKKYIDQRDKYRVRRATACACVRG